jgi:hypothetical protein
VIVVEVFVLATVIVVAADVAEVKLLSPLYVAWMACVPVDGDVIVAIAVAPPDRVPVATVVPSNVNVTVPVAVSVLAVCDAKVAVTNIVEFAVGVVVAGVAVSVVVTFPTMIPTLDELVML